MIFVCVIGEKGYCFQIDILIFSFFFSVDVRILKYWIYILVWQFLDGDIYNYCCYFWIIGLSWYIFSYWLIISYDDYGVWIFYVGYILICKIICESFCINI